jgi:hypothetical protein
MTRHPKGIERHRRPFPEPGVTVPGCPDTVGIARCHRRTGTHAVQTHEHAASADVIVAAADDNVCHVSAFAQHRRTANRRLQRVLRRIFDHDLFFRRAEIKQEPPHDKGFRRGMVAETARDEKPHATAALTRSPIGLLDPTAKGAAGRSVGANGRAKNDEIVVTLRSVNQGRCAFRLLPCHHQLLDLGNGLCRVQALGAGLGAVHDRVAPV